MPGSGRGKAGFSPGPAVFAGTEMTIHVAAVGLDLALAGIYAGLETT
jgi:hypothetical protein